MSIHALFIVLCFLFDEVLMVLFPNSFAMQGMVFVSNIGFCALVLTIKKFNIVDSLLFSCGFGMLYDVMFAQSFFQYAIVFMVIACLLQFWAKHMTDTLVESFIVCIVAIFMKDVLIYGWTYLCGHTSLDFMVWVQRYELLTLFMNTVFVVVIYFLMSVKEDYLEYKSIQLRKGEKVEWFRLKSK